MKRSDLIWGSLLLGAGAVLLVQNFGVFGPAQALLWTLLFALSGAAFVGVVLSERSQWWALIPGATLLSLALLTGVQQLAPAFGAAWGGPLFLAGIGLGFGAIYLLDRGRWWAIIPCGALLSLALVAAVETLRPGADGGSVLFFGLAVTFGLIYLLPTPPQHMAWALFPAGLCALIGLLILTATTTALPIVWPIALILAGLYLIYRTLRSRRAQLRPTTRLEDRHDDPTLPQPH